jgi:hypothetical protein
MYHACTTLNCYSDAIEFQLVMDLPIKPRKKRSQIRGRILELQATKKML